MRKFLSLAVMCSLAFPAMALAQVEAPKEAADDIEREYGDVEQETEQTVKSVVTEEDETTLVVPGDVGEEDTVVKVYETKETTIVEEEESTPFKDMVSWQVLASAFYRLGGYIDDGVIAGTYNSLGYPYTNYNGFGLNFAGGDVMITGEKWAVRLDLRFGTGADLLTPISAAGFGGVKQAYAAWMPTEGLNFDFGFFDTIFGAEVVDEWENANYTRGALYFLRQPFNHMGVRMGAELGDIVGFTAMVTNGGVYGGTPVDDNEVPALGWQFGFSPDGHNSVRRRGLREGYREVGIFFGGNHAPSGNDGNRDWANFFDIVVSLGFDWFHLLLNGDYYLDGGGSTDFQYGHSLALIFDMSDHWSLGLRGEHLSGNDVYRSAEGGFGGLSTGTITLRYKPVEYLVLSLEGRGEWATRDIYFSRSATVDDVTGELIPNKGHNYAAIIGMTAHIGN